MSTPPRPGIIFTFYSFKGGMERSMALAGVASLMARRGRHVLVVDWDLEAPGIEKLFSASRATTPGLVDLLGSFTAGTPLKWQDCVHQVRPTQSAQPVDLLAAGWNDASYFSRVRSLSFERLFAEYDLGGKLEALRAEWGAAYDVVLVDSPSGITDIGGICTVHLPDVLVASFSRSEQSLEGTRYVLKRATEEHARLPVDRKRLITVPTLSHDQNHLEDGLDQPWHEHAATELNEFFLDWLPKEETPLQALLRFRIPHQAQESLVRRGLTGPRPCLRAVHRASGGMGEARSRASSAPTSG